MTKQEIIELAREAGCEETFGTDAFRFTIEELECFANLVAAKERERCAEECEKLVFTQNDGLDGDWEWGQESGAKRCAETIRSLK